MSYFCIMEKRIKILHWLTIVAIVAFCMMQCYWIYNSYVYTLENHEEELYETVLDVMQDEQAIRKSVKRPDINILTNTRFSASAKAGILNTTFDIYVVDLNKIDIPEISDSEVKEIIRLYETSSPDGITHHNFKISGKPSDPNEYEALERFTVDLSNPFNPSTLDSLLVKRGLMVKNIRTEKADSMVWLPKRTEHTSIISPQVTITYPYDIFEGETVSITLSVGITPVITKMIDLLIISFILSALLTICLVAQITTIQKQHRLEELRKDFIYTMIHELKRPISTLKMCVSFMRNDKLMNDKESKDAIIADSSNELDNLTSYFSKLRDLNSNDSSEIPLSISVFCLRDVIDNCVKKISVPSNKTVDIHLIHNDDFTITADKMHITNIVNNLLENSIKYSKENINIEIDYHKEINDVFISIKDNGLGISKRDIKFIFDKFYRCKSLYNKNIPGMGLGLTYVRLLVDAHRGNIEVDSEEGTGTVFTIKLPQNE